MTNTHDAIRAHMEGRLIIKPAFTKQAMLAMRDKLKTKQEADVIEVRLPFNGRSIFFAALRKLREQKTIAPEGLWFKYVNIANAPLVEAPKKRRGRPPGSKNKKS